MSTKLNEILQQYLTSAEQYQNQTTIYGHTNPAQDIRAAVNFAQNICRELEIEHANPKPKNYAEALQTSKEQFEQTHKDEDGFGIGTLVDIIKQLENTEPD